MNGPAAAPPGPFVVGLGASAGGMEVLKAFFEHVPADTGLAFVVIVHLSPRHESYLAEVLQRHTALPVVQVTEDAPFEPDTVYVIPPGRQLSSVDSHLRLSPMERERHRRLPVDHFFRTLASTHGERAVGVVLSGTGSDGAVGLKVMKEQGALTIVQDPALAEFDGMPRAAIANSLVDWVLPVPEMLPRIIDYFRSSPDLPLLSDDEEADQDSHEVRRVERLLGEIFSLVRRHTNQDFADYKRSTVIRRIRRRMQIVGLPDVDDYLARLERDPAEVRQLAEDFLITVTRFFRDAECFDHLAAHVLPELMQGRDEQDVVRVWSVGCATGEEAYTLAILLLEAAEQAKRPPEVQIFASDLHDRSLASAREGVYPDAIAADVEDERLRRWFRREDSSYRVTQALREAVVFANHNLLGDPPFSRIDLVVCRNLLIYLNRGVQQHAVELFHYALKSGGFLMLGTSETLDRTALFQPEDKSAGIYRRRNVPAPEPTLPVFPQLRERFDRQQSERARDPISYGRLHERVVEQYAPPSLLVDRDHRVVHASEHVGLYLRVQGGEPSVDVFRLVREELQLELRAALQSAFVSGRPARSRPCTLPLDGRTAAVAVQVRPAHGPDLEGLYLVLFDETEALVSGGGPRGETGGGESDAGVDELRRTQSHLQRVVEQYETGQEEMRVTNEELQSSNEELRSTMEELETSKEELQSMNEELQTVNQENRLKVEELSQLTSDLHNLLGATQIATLFLDRGLRIARITPKVSELFNVRQSDRGRPLSDLTHRLGEHDLIADAGRVLEGLVPVEREVESDGGHWYLTRLLPYRSGDDRIDGVVITFVDITARRHAEEALRTSEQRFRSLFETLTQGVLFHAVPGGEIVEANPSARDLLGLAPGTLHGVRPESLGWEVLDEHGQPLAPESYPAARAIREQRNVTGALVGFQHARTGERRWMLVDAVPQFLGDATTPYRVHALLTDITRRREAEVALRELTEQLEERAEARAQALMQSEERFRALIDASTQMVWTTDPQGRMVEDSPVWRNFTGQSTEHWLGEAWAEMVHPEDRAAALRRWRDAVAAEQPLDQEYRLWHASGEWRWVHVRAVPVRDAGGPIREWVGMTTDISGRRRVEAEREQLLAEREQLLRELTRAEQRERRRLSLILHDELQQELYGIELKVATAMGAVESGEDPSQHLHEVQYWLRESIRLTRQLAVDLVPPVFQEASGFEEALHWLATQMRDLHGLEVEVTTRDLPSLNRSSEMWVLVFQTIRELLFNVVKHAGTDRASLDLAPADGQLEVRVTDHGRGFSGRSAPRGTQREVDPEFGFGLSTARERLTLFGGQMEVRSEPGDGTVVTLRVPMQAFGGGTDGDEGAGDEAGDEAGDQDGDEDGGGADG